MKRAGKAYPYSSNPNTNWVRAVVNGVTVSRNLGELKADELFAEDLSIQQTNATVHWLSVL